MKKTIKIIKNIIFIISVVLFYYCVVPYNHQYYFRMTYSRCIIFMIILSLFLFTYGLLDNKIKTYKRNINIYIFLYLALLISITFILGRTKLLFFDWWYGGQYTPFFTITRQFKYGSTKSIIKNIFGNGVMLLPLSFLLMIKDKKFNNLLRQLMIIVPIVICIELLQATTHTGAFDVDDIILNIMGIVVFTMLMMLFHLIDKIRKIFYSDFHLPLKIKYVLFFLMAIIVLFYNTWILFS